MVFTLHGEQYAVPIETVSEIVRYTRLTATAAASGLIRGMISLRGAVVPIADLSSRLARDPHTGEGAQIVVLALCDGLLGLIVDHVEGVRRIPNDRISVTPVPGAEKGFGDEVAAIDDELVLLIDPQRVLGSLLRAPSTRTTKAKPAAKSAKPAAKRAAKAAVKRAAKPAAKRAAKPAVKRAAKPAVKRAAKPAAKAAVRPAAKRQPSTRRRPPAA